MLVFGGVIYNICDISLKQRLLEDSNVLITGYTSVKSRRAHELGREQLKDLGPVIAKMWVFEGDEGHELLDTKNHPRIHEFQISPFFVFI